MEQHLKPADKIKGTRAQATLSGKHSHIVVTLNIGGSREALCNALLLPHPIILIQEHRTLGASIPGLQNLVAAFGWHGVWDPATTDHKHGRSGGTAILVRKPLAIFRREAPNRCTAATVQWTRKTALHLLSVYGTHHTHLGAEEQNAQLLDSLQSYLAGLGRVPWIIGGDWNLEPQEVRPTWGRGGTYHTPQVPTQTFGKIIDWFLTSPILQPTVPDTQCLPGTDHAAVLLTLPGDIPSTLGWRLAQPTALDREALEVLRRPEQQSKWQDHFGTPPDSWAEWNEQAEHKLCTAIGVSPPSNPTRGAPIRYIKQTISRPQIDRLAVGANRAMAKLRLRQARVQRLNTLIRNGAGEAAEAVSLRTKLKGKLEVDANEAHILKRWGEAVEKQRKRAWSKYVQTNNATGGGKLFKWVQRTQMEVHLTQLKAQSPTGENTLAGRLQAAAATWHLLWEGGRPHIPSFHTALRPLTGEDLRKVLQKLPEGKARGADGWAPKELLSLPVSWLDKLAEFCNGWEKQGKWPQVLNNTIIALVPKARSYPRRATQANRYHAIHIQAMDGGTQGRR